MGKVVAYVHVLNSILKTFYCISYSTQLGVIFTIISFLGDD